MFHNAAALGRLNRLSLARKQGEYATIERK
jgi:hypothetical protein